MACEEYVFIPLKGDKKISAIISIPDQFVREKKPAVILAHGAGNGMFHPLLIHMANVLAEAGYLCLRFNFLYRDEEKKTPDSEGSSGDLGQGVWYRRTTLCQAVVHGCGQVHGREDRLPGGCRQPHSGERTHLSRLPAASPGKRIRCAIDTSITSGCPCSFYRVPRSFLQSRQAQRGTGQDRFSEHARGHRRGRPLVQGPRFLRCVRPRDLCQDSGQDALLAQNHLTFTRGIASARKSIHHKKGFSPLKFPAFFP